ncbi:hypothetical protein AX17_002381 [Amanita inopinata Kibby_2008]|nr:hypothetical protein AX17_002381 [Amanita inopinata Kibby_2008]
MAPKKGKKIPLNEFLGDNAFGSWADEMDALPSAPTIKTDDDHPRLHDRFTRREDTVRMDRPGPPREDIPLPSRPPYTAFVGNLAFDLTEPELEDFFSKFKTKSVKIIRDREEKPKGFGYVEFDELDGLKDALAKTGSTLSGRILRVSVAEPPKERSNLGGNEDSSKFDGPWRREGPLPDIPERETPRRKLDGISSHERGAASESSNDWRANRNRISEAEATSFKQKGSGFSTPSIHSSVADKEETWMIGSKFKPSEDAPGRGAPRTRTDPKETAADEPDWRSSARTRPAGRNGDSPTASTPPTPQINRRKLELLPRSGNASSSPSPMSSPKMSPVPASNVARQNPFGAARPVDVSVRDREVGERLERDREAVKERLSMSRTSSRGASERTTQNTAKASTSSHTSLPQHKTSSVGTGPSSNVRPTLSFANVAANKGSGPKDREPQEKSIDHVAEKLADIVL